MSRRRRATPLSRCAPLDQLNINARFQIEDSASQKRDRRVGVDNQSEPRGLLDGSAEKTVDFRTYVPLPFLPVLQIPLSKFVRQK